MAVPLVPVIVRRPSARSSGDPIRDAIRARQEAAALVSEANQDLPVADQLERKANEAAYGLRERMAEAANSPAAAGIKAVMSAFSPKEPDISLTAPEKDAPPMEMAQDGWSGKGDAPMSAPPQRPSPRPASPGRSSARSPDRPLLPHQIVTPEERKVREQGVAERAADMADPAKAKEARDAAVMEAAGGVKADKERQEKEKQASYAVQERAAADAYRTQLADYDRRAAAWLEQHQKLHREWAANPTFQNEQAVRDHAALQPQRPMPEPAAIGGKDPAELAEFGGEDVDVTLGKLKSSESAADQEAARALELYQKENPHSLEANFSAMPPEERLGAMRKFGQQLYVNGQRVKNKDGTYSTDKKEGSFPHTVPVSPGTKDGWGNRPGEVILHPSHPALDAASRGPSRFPFVDPTTSAPRSKPNDTMSFTGSWNGPRQMTSPAMNDYLFDGWNLDGPPDGEWLARLAAYAHEVGFDPSKAGDTPEAQAKFWESVLRRAKEDQRLLKMKSADGESPKYKIAASGDPDQPYALKMTDKAVTARDNARREKDAIEFVGAHPIPDTLKGDWKPQNEGELHPLHQQLITAARTGDMPTFVRIRDQILAHENSGQKAVERKTRDLARQTHVMRNPQTAPALFAEELAAAGDDPDAQAAVMRRWGGAQPTLWPQADAAARHSSVRRVAESEAEGARAKAEAENPTPPNRIAEINAQLDPVIVDSVSGEAPGNGYVQHAAQTLALAGIQGDAAVDWAATQFMKIGGAGAANHSVMDHYMRLAWEATKTLSTKKYADQFLRRVMSWGVPEVEARNWLNRNGHGAATPAAPKPSAPDDVDRGAARQ